MAVESTALEDMAAAGEATHNSSSHRELDSSSSGAWDPVLPDTKASIF